MKFDCRTGFRLPDGVCNPVRNVHCQSSANIPDGVSIAGRSLQPRPKHSLSVIGKHSRRGFDCRTGFATPSEPRPKHSLSVIGKHSRRGFDYRTEFATPSETFIVSHRQTFQTGFRLPDGVCNPVRNRQTFRTGFRLPDGVCNPVRNIHCQSSANIPDGVSIAGRGLQPRLDCRTGFATPSETFIVSHRQTFQTGLQTPLPDGVCNPVRNIHCQSSANIPDGVSIAGRGLQPRRHRQTFQTGLQTPSGESVL